MMDDGVVLQDGFIHRRIAHLSKDFIEFNEETFLGSIWHVNHSYAIRTEDFIRVVEELLHTNYKKEGDFVPTAFMFLITFMVGVVIGGLLMIGWGVVD